MSPVAETRITPRTIAIMAVSAVIVAIGLLVFLVVSLPRLTSSGTVEVQLGSDRFDAGYATVQAEAIAVGGPVLYSDVAGGQRDIYLQHLGDDPLEGWTAFDARRPGTDRACTVVWQVDGAFFTDPCGGPDVTAEGTGLGQFTVEVTGEADAERVVIDIKTPGG